jgi:hypothetical protein
MIDLDKKFVVRFLHNKSGKVWNVCIPQGTIEECRAIVASRADDVAKYQDGKDMICRIVYEEIE